MQKIKAVSVPVSCGRNHRCAGCIVAPHCSSLRMIFSNTPAPVMMPEYRLVFLLFHQENIGKAGCIKDVPYRFTDIGNDHRIFPEFMVCHQEDTQTG